MIRRLQKTTLGSFQVILPKTVVEILGIQPGEKISFELTDDKKLILTPVRGV